MINCFPSASYARSMRRSRGWLALALATMVIVPRINAQSQAPEAAPPASTQAAPAHETPAQNAPGQPAPTGTAPDQASPKPPDPGSISGTVLDERGTPVDRALVQLYDGFGMPIHLRSVHTDHYGRFVVYSLHPGDWALYPSKVEDGYADQVFGFGISRNFHPPHAIVKSNTDTPNVVLHLPPKAATVHIDVTDADTNIAIRSVTVELQPATGATGPMGVPGWVHGRRPAPTDLLIAPGVIRLSITSLGYQPWTATEENKPILTLRPGEKRILEVKLHRAPNPGITPGVRMRPGAPGQPTGPSSPAPNEPTAAAPPSPPAAPNQ